MLNKFSWCSGYHICLTHRRSPVRSRAKTYIFSIDLVNMAKFWKVFSWALDFQRHVQRDYFRNCFLNQQATLNKQNWLSIFGYLYFHFIFIKLKQQMLFLNYVLHYNYWKMENVRRKISHLPLGADQLGGHPSHSGPRFLEL